MMDVVVTVGSLVRILDTPELKEWKLSDLVNRTGIVTEVCDASTKRNKGYYVKIDTEEWFIPLESVMDEWAYAFLSTR